MVIYQVVNEQNQAVAEFQEYASAQHSAQDFTLWHEDHYYHVETVDDEALH